MLTPRPVETAPPAPVQGRAPYQPNLFAAPETPKVVPIRPGDESRPRAARAPARRSAVAGAPRYEQQSLPLAQETATSRAEQQDGILACDARVAGAGSRALAFVVDLSLVIAAAGGVITGFILWSDVPLDGRSAAILCGGGLLLVWLLYQLLWCAANLDTAGMRWLRLRCVDFNGCLLAGPRQRLVRLGMTCLGTLAAGLGLVWALVDEDGLAWQDHVSKTFPTPY